MFLMAIPPVSPYLAFSDGMQRMWGRKWLNRAVRVMNGDGGGIGRVVVGDVLGCWFVGRGGKRTNTWVILDHVMQEYQADFAACHVRDVQTINNKKKPTCLRAGSIFHDSKWFIWRGFRKMICCNIPCFIPCVCFSCAQNVYFRFPPLHPPELVSKVDDHPAIGLGRRWRPFRCLPEIWKFEEFAKKDWRCENADYLSQLKDWIMNMSKTIKLYCI